MSSATCGVLLCLALIASSTASPANAGPPPDERPAAGPGRRLALVVGTSHYGPAWTPLPNARGDAHALALELRQRFAYRVTSLVDPTARAFKDALAAIAREASDHDDLLIFVAGHGHFDSADNAGYLVFSDATTDCERGCYSLDHLRRALFSTRALHALVMLDTCYAGTFDVRVALSGDELRVRGTPAELRDYAQEPSRLLFASVGKQTTPDGVRGRHSPFMERILARLARPGPRGVVSLDQLFGAVDLPEVMRPIPFSSGRPHHPNGTFLFVEQVSHCEALASMLDGARDDFAALRLEVRHASEWATVWRSRWLVPGARSCDVWRWGADLRTELRCDLGPIERSQAPARAAALYDETRRCLDGGGASWEAETRERTYENELHLERALTQAESSARVGVHVSCRESCALSLVID